MVIDTRAREKQKKNGELTSNDETHTEIDSHKNRSGDYNREKCQSVRSIQSSVQKKSRKNESTQKGVKTFKKGS
jgi:hypothetical protein